MLLALQFPLADSRPFVKDGGRSSVPRWLEPRPDEEFLRYFGAIRLRKSGGLPGWVGENEVCEADQALRFPRGLGSVAVDPHFLVQMQCIYRRFFSDGFAVGKFEVGVGTLLAHRKEVSLDDVTRDTTQPTREELTALIDRFLRTPVEIRNPETRQIERTELARAGKPLATLYRVGSSVRPIPSAPDWWVVHGSPLLFLEARAAKPVEFPKPTRQIELPQEYRLRLSYCLWPYAGGRIRTWLLERPSRSIYREEYRNARTLRVYLMRLHAEHECLQALLRNIREGNLSVQRGDSESQALQDQLTRSMQRIGSYESRAARDFNPEIAALARQSVDAMSPGQRDRLVERLKELDLRGNVVRGVKEYADAAIAAAEGVGAAEMALETKSALAQALLACPSMEKRGARDIIVNALPKEIKNTAPRSDIPLVDVINLIGAALNYQDGLATLVELVRQLERDSLPMQEVDRVLAEWRTQQAAA